MENTRHMLGQIFGIVLVCVALIVVIKVRQGVSIEQLIADPRLLFDGMFSGPAGS